MFNIVTERNFQIMTEKETPKKKPAVRKGFVKGDKKPSKAGRRKGTPNKTTTELKAAIMNAFEKVGGEDYLVLVAQTNPKVFCMLLGKVLPAELHAKVDASVTLTVAKDEMDL
jgi:hypothetical protein